MGKDALHHSFDVMLFGQMIDFLHDHKKEASSAALNKKVLGPYIVVYLIPRLQTTAFWYLLARNAFDDLFIVNVNLEPGRYESMICDDVRTSYVVL